MHQQRLGARAEYRQQEAQRVRDSATLAAAFEGLKTLTVDLAYYDPTGLTRNSQIKYTVNVANAKAVFRFNCPNSECVGGDFDMSEALADAVADHKTSVSGKLVCQGWRSKATVDKVHCNNILRYTLRLGY